MRYEHRVCSALLVTLVLGCACPAHSQAPPQGPQTRPSPGSGNRPNPGNGNRPNPGNGGGNRPGPGNPGGPSIQPPRPQPPRPQPPRPNPPRPQPPRPNPGNRPRPPQWGQRPPVRPPYHFRPNDRLWLQRYYHRNLGYINIGNRPRFVIGSFFPWAYVPYLTPLPGPVMGYLPPPPPGYQMGYFDGYVVVYDPVTYFIVNVIDLM